MANWADTAYAIEGNKETIQRIYDAILKHPIQKDSTEGWEGNVLHALNIDFENMKIGSREPYMRGFIQEEPSFDGDVLRFYAQEAWEATDFADVLNERMKNIKVFYSVEEPGCEVYATNDKEGKYFPDRYHVDACIDGNYFYEYFIEEKELYEWLSKVSDGKITDKESAEKFNDEHIEQCDDDNYIRIYEFQIVD